MAVPEQAAAAREQVVRGLVSGCGCYTRCVPRLSPFVGLVVDVAVVGPARPGHGAAVRRYQRRAPTRLPRPRARSAWSISTWPKARDDPAGPRTPGTPGRRTCSSDWEAARAPCVARDAPAYYAYEMAFAAAGRRRARSAACSWRWSWSPGAAASIPHERTMPGPVEDRLRLLRATRTHLSAVYGTIAGPCRAARRPPATATVGRAAAVRDPRRAGRAPPDVAGRRPTRDVAAWLARDAAPDRRRSPPLHDRPARTATSSDAPARSGPVGPRPDAGRRRGDRAPAGPALPSGAVDRARRPRSATASRDLEDVLAALSDDDVTIGERRDAKADVVVYRVARLDGRPAGRPRAPRDGARGRRPGRVAALRARRRRGRRRRSSRARRVAAYFLPPTTPERIRAVVERGERLPQKSTYFWPKPRTGMVMMPARRPRTRRPAYGSWTGSSFLIPVATTSVRLRAPAPLR